MEEYCKVVDCYNHPSDDDVYCYSHSYYSGPNTFAERMNEAYKTMEVRFATLEADVKRLKRELGLK